MAQPCVFRSCQQTAFSDYGHALDLFAHGGDVSGKTAEEVFNGDYKIFTSGDVRFGVGQGSYMTEKNRRAAQALVGPYLPEALAKQQLDYIFYMFTDVRNSSTSCSWRGRERRSWWRRPSTPRWRTAWPPSPGWSAGRSR